ncbi:hypothetical protein CDAR_223351 [Caerostris darwini]|uniref:Uncharacterized protein n=1 Tax=Caerostris darwini TaxID=1538125 RepID=A0AAV4W884_9ARAC|nr:hypothetical protein CDAR_223351 [Caerostris darwini]
MQFDSIYRKATLNSILPSLLTKLNRLLPRINHDYWHSKRIYESLTTPSRIADDHRGTKNKHMRGGKGAKKKSNRRMANVDLPAPLLSIILRHVMPHYENYINIFFLGPIILDAPHHPSQSSYYSSLSLASTPPTLRPEEKSR